VDLELLSCHLHGLFLGKRQIFNEKMAANAADKWQTGFYLL